MATWLSLAEARVLWRDAPADDTVLTSYLEASKSACLAYAPTLPETETGVIAPGAVTQTRRNLFADPRGTSTTSTFWGSTGGSSVALSTVTDMTGSINTGVRSTRNATAAARLVDFRVGTTFLASTAYRVRFKVRSSVALSSVTVAFRPEPALSGASVTVATISIPAGDSYVNVTGTTHANAPSATAGVSLIQTTGVIGSTLDVTEVLVELASTSNGVYFDGNSPDVTVEDRTYEYAWTGVENASPSAETYRPDVFVADPQQVPESYRLAQYLQARNTWNAGKAAQGSGDFDGSSYGITSFPLDWSVKQLLRPQQGLGAIA